MTTIITQWLNYFIEHIESLFNHLSPLTVNHLDTNYPVMMSDDYSTWFWSCWKQHCHAFVECFSYENVTTNPWLLSSLASQYKNLILRLKSRVASPRYQQLVSAFVAYLEEVASLSTHKGANLSNILAPLNKFKSAVKDLDETSTEPPFTLSLVKTGDDLILMQGTSPCILTPLTLACLRQDQGAVKLLLATSDIFRSQNLSPVHVAAFIGNVEILALLSEHGFELDSADIYGRTPLHFACQQLHEQTVRFLLARGADPTRVSSSDPTIQTLLEPVYENMQNIILPEYAYIGLQRSPITGSQYHCITLPYGHSTDFTWDFLQKLGLSLCLLGPAIAH